MKRHLPILASGRSLRARTDESQWIRLAAPLEIVAAVDGAPADAAPRFRMLAYSGGAMRLAGWHLPVVVDVAGVTAMSDRLPVRREHLEGVGHVDRLTLDPAAGTIRAEGAISRDTEAAREVIASARRGFPWRASIGARPEEVEFIPPGMSVRANGRSYAGPVNLVRRSTLGEISFVDLGAEDGTQVKIAASAAGQAKENHMEFEAWLKARGFEVASLSEAQKETLKAAWSADPEGGKPKEPPAAPPAKPEEAKPPIQASGTVTPDPAAEMRAKAGAEAKRIAAVSEAAKDFPAIKATAIAEGWDATRTELEVLRAARPKAPAVHTREGGPPEPLVLEAAACLSGRLHDVEKRYEPKVLEEASSRFRGPIGIQRLVMEAAWMAGCDVRHYAGHEKQILAAAFSTNAFSALLSNVANKFLLEGFLGVDQTCMRIAAHRPVNDFKTVTSYRLLSGGGFEKVAPDGELKHGVLGAESFTNKADTGGEILAITRQDMRNDDLGALTGAPRHIGVDGMRYLNDVFWAVFLNNAAFFSAGHANYLSGADTALGLDSLTAAEVAFLSQTVPVKGGSKTAPIGLSPSMLLVPTAKKVTAETIYKSPEYRDSTASTKAGTANVHAGKYRVESSPYMHDARLTGSSAKKWYLLADPLVLPVIEIAFLDGVEQPTVQTAEADFNVLGIQMRGFFDFGVALQDYRGGVGMKGEV